MKIKDAVLSLLSGRGGSKIIERERTKEKKERRILDRVNRERKTRTGTDKTKNKRIAVAMQRAKKGARNRKCQVAAHSPGECATSLSRSETELTAQTPEASLARRW